MTLLVRFSTAVLCALLVLAPTRASAQLVAAKDGPIIYGHHHLNVSNAERVKALIAGAFFLFVLLATACLDARWLGAAAAALAVAIVVNGAFYRLVLRAAGLPTAVAAVLLHQLYFLYSAVTYVWCVVERRIGLAPPPPSGNGRGDSGQSPPAGVAPSSGA